MGKLRILTVVMGNFEKYGNVGRYREQGKKPGKFL
jgi:hypothetical protein